MSLSLAYLIFLSWLSFLAGLSVFMLNKNNTLMMFISLEVLVVSVCFILSFPNLDGGLWMIVFLPISAIMSSLGLSVYTFFNRSGLDNLNLAMW